MADPDYRDTLIEAADLLREMEQRLFTAMVNTGMYGAFCEVHTSFDVGDTFEFEPEMFEDSGDNNLELIVGLLKATAAARSRMEERNGLPGGAG